MPTEISEPFGETAIKTRIPPSWKERLEKIAFTERLKVSDIARRAIDQYLTRQKRTKAARS